MQKIIQSTVKPAKPTNMSAALSNDLLLVTAASGKQAASLPSSSNGGDCASQVNSQASKDRVQHQHREAEVVIADLWSQVDCHQLLQGVTACFLVTPGFHANETECGYHIIDAAVSQGSRFKHMDFSSVIFLILRKLVNYDSRRHIEEYLVESGLPYTILQPTTLMENLPIARLIAEPEPTYIAL